MCKRGLKVSGVDCSKAGGEGRGEEKRRKEDEKKNEERRERKDERREKSEEGRTKREKRKGEDDERRRRRMNRTLVVLGGSWVDFGSFWGGLGGLLGGLGGSFGVLEGSWAALGPSWVVRVVLSSTRSATHPNLGRCWGPKGSQDEAQIRPKTDQNRCRKRSRKKKALEDRLGAVLGRSWVVLGAVLGSKSCSRPRWRSFF